MLRTLEVENFRSLRKATVRFSQTGLTVVVGANGTGKSNLIKCLEFLGAIAREGLESTVRAHNGVDAILPKAIAPKQIKNTCISFRYEVELPRFRPYPPDAPPILVNHDLILKARTLSAIEVVEELLRFAEPLAVQRTFELRTGHPPTVDQLASVREALGSWLIVRRDSSGTNSVAATPAIAGRNLRAYLSWFGLPFLADTMKDNSPELISATLSGLFSPRNAADPASSKGPGALSSLLDNSNTAMLAFSAQANAFASYMRSIRRFDLQLSQLRRQQDIAAFNELAQDGRGLPAAVRRTKGNSKENWQRVASTLAELAPHVADMRVSQLKSGQEFVEFIEEKTGRPVESWQSSDGTLRALAILLAVETHPERGAILIEEPEQGLHPWAVRTLVAHLRSVIADRNLQVILTTHSQQVLDSVEPSEVLVAGRTGGGTTFRTIEEILEGNSVDQGEVGRMWVSGLLGGVPSYE